MIYPENNFSRMAHTARDIASGQTSPYILAPSTNPNLGIEHFYEHKSDVFALLANVISSDIDRAYKNRDNDFMSRRSSSGYSLFYTLYQGMQRGIEAELVRDISQKDIDLEIVLRKWGKFVEDHAGGSRQYARNPWKILIPAIGNATMFMAGLSSVLPEVAKRDVSDLVTVSPEYLTQTLENSEYLVNSFANSGIDAFSDSLKKMMNLGIPGGGVNSFPHEGQYFDKRVFTIGYKKNKPRLEVREDLIPGKNPGDIGCPALVNLTGESAISTMWKWNVEWSSQIYAAAGVNVV